MMVYPPPPAKGGISVTNEDLHCLNDGEFLNDVILDFYLKWVLVQMFTTPGLLHVGPRCLRDREVFGRDAPSSSVLMRKGGSWLRRQCGLPGNRKVAGSIPGCFQPSVEVSLSEAPHPDELAVALRGRLRRQRVDVWMNG